MVDSSSSIGLESPSVIALLVINDLKLLPKLVIESIQNVTNSKIFVGYINDSDILQLKTFRNLEFIDLSKEATYLNLLSVNGNYRSFDEDSFFSLVQLKWPLIQKLMQLCPESNIIYTDVDVLWVRDASQLVSDSFSVLSRAHILIQSFTLSPTAPRLCMGFAAFRNSAEARSIVEKCTDLHKSLLIQNPRVGDDDVMTEYFLTSGYPESIHQLPQSTFPVGNMLNLFSKKSLYPALHPEKPFIFHANHVVGLTKKLELLELFSRNQTINLNSISQLRSSLIRSMIFVRFMKFLLITVPRTQLKKKIRKAVKK